MKKTYIALGSVISVGTAVAGWVINDLKSEVNKLNDKVLSVQEIEDKFNAMIGKADTSLLKDIQSLKEKFETYMVDMEKKVLTKELFYKFLWEELKKESK